MEKYITMPTSDWFEIRWILNSKEKSDKLIIFVHGLTWYSHEAHYVCGKDYFIDEWYDVLRFNLYHWWEKNRKLRSCSIDDHARDIESVLEYISTDYKEINLIWHSLWGPSIVRMNYNINLINNIVFWDPAFDSREYWVGFDTVWDMFLFDWRDGRNIQVSPQIVQQRSEDHMTMLEKFPKNKAQISIIFAGKNNKIEFKSKTDAMWVQSCIIEWANHGFTQEWKFKELFKKTLEYLEK